MSYPKSTFEKFRQMIFERFSGDIETDDEKVTEAIDDIIVSESRKYRLTLKEKEEIRKDLFYSLRKLDILQELIDDEDVNEIMVNGIDRIFFEKKGRIFRYEKSFSDNERLMDIIQQIAGACNRVVNEQSPIADARLSNNDRVNIVLPPVALDGPILTIRRFPKNPITMKDLILMGSITEDAAKMLEMLVSSAYTVIVSGGTSTGKTTFLNALSQFIPKDERIITIEDNAELQLLNIDNIVRLEAKDADVNNSRAVTIRDLIKTALRMRPSRIIIGEVRGEEAFDFLNSLNTGHSGSLGSIHANSASEMMLRIETMVRMGQELPVSVIRQQIASGIEIAVQLFRDHMGVRRVQEISEVLGYNGADIMMNILYKRNKDNILEKIGELRNAEKRDKYEKYCLEMEKSRKKICS